MGNGRFHTGGLEGHVCGPRRNYRATWTEDFSIPGAGHVTGMGGVRSDEWVLITDFT